MDAAARRAAASRLQEVMGAAAIFDEHSDATVRQLIDNERIRS